MADYRPYLDPEYRDPFEAFLTVYEKEGVQATDPKALKNRLDPELYEEWDEFVVKPGKLNSYWNAKDRLAVLDDEGIAAEILFHDFAIPFVMSSPGNAAINGLVSASQDQLEAGRRAYNRWVVDFCSAAPDRWRPLLAVSFRNPDGVIEELGWAKEHGFAGLTLPIVPDTERIYQAQYDGIYSALEDLEMLLEVHVSISNVSPTYTGAPSIASASAMVGNEQMVAAHQLLPQLIFGGVLERHPRMTTVFTEMQSDWTVGALQKMDYSFDRSGLRRDIREVIPIKPSEYWARQCYIGSSLFSQAEIGARHTIGLDKMMLGMDLPHHEGSWRHHTQRYLHATLGAEGVTAVEARTMLSETAATVLGFDLEKLAPVAARIGPDSDEILNPLPVQPNFRGDLNRPLMFAG
jgi:predicted TIM-barrel fold metal-dependent hydrolase